MEIFTPESMDEALATLAANPGAVLLAGGTDVMVDINLSHARPEVIVSLRRVAELNELTDRFIGSGVTYRRLESSPHQALAEASRTVGSPQIRAVGTIGGNLGTASPAGDALPFLVAVEAQVVLASVAGRRRMSVADFLVGPKENALNPGELIVGVELPESVPPRQAFSKVGVRQAMAIAIASACVLRTDDGETRIAVGAVGPKVLRVTEAEALASRNELSPALLEQIQLVVTETARPITDHRATAEYRRHAAGVIARRALERTVAA